MRRFDQRLSLVLILWLGAMATGAAFAQSAGTAIRTADELQALVAPIALYPDSLLAHVLPASTAPLDVVEAARYLREQGGAVEESPEVPWLPSVRALLRFPDVVYKMDAEIRWTEELGAAVIAQQNDVMDAIQHVRKLAEESGVLASNDKIVVEVEQEVVKIVPAEPEVIYVPVYEPEVIYVTEPATTVVVEDDRDDTSAAAAGLLGFGTGVLVGAAFAEDDCDWDDYTIVHYGYYGWYDPNLYVDDVWVWRAGPGGIYDPRGLYDPRGIYDPRGLYDPRGIYDPRGVYDPRGLTDPRGARDPRGALDPRGVADPRGLTDPRGRRDPRGAYDPRGVADPRGLTDPRGRRDPRGAYDPRGVADPRGFSRPSAGNGPFGEVASGADTRRASSRGGSSLSGGGRSSGSGRGGRSGGGGRRR